MNCPACGALVHDRHAATDLAHCTTCEHIWEVQGPAAEGRRIDLGPAPGGVRARPRLEGTCVDLDLPWAHEHGSRIHVLVVGAVASLLFLPGLSSVAVAAALMFAWAAVTQNSTTVRVRPTSVSVEHGPLPTPMFWSGTVNVEELGGLRMEERSVGGGVGSVAEATSFSLRAGGVALLERWSSEDKVAFVHDCIRQGVDVPDVASSPTGEGAARGREGVAVGTAADGRMELTLPWDLHLTPPRQAALTLGVVAALSGGGLTTILVAVPLAAFGLYAYRNTTTLRIGADGVAVTHGPLVNPLVPDEWFEASEVASTTVEEEDLGSFRGPTLYTLKGHSRPVLRAWVSRARLEYVSECIEEGLRLDPMTTEEEAARRRSVVERVRAAQRARALRG